MLAFLYTIFFMYITLPFFGAWDFSVLPFFSNIDTSKLCSILMTQFFGFLILLLRVLGCHYEFIIRKVQYTHFLNSCCIYAVSVVLVFLTSMFLMNSLSDEDQRN